MAQSAGNAQYDALLVVLLFYIEIQDDTELAQLWNVPEAKYL
jgi:hypothetical protein